MLDGSTHPYREAPRRRRPARRLALISLLALAALGVAASAAQAAPTVGNATLTCKKIVVTYSGFPNLPNNTIKEKVRIDGVTNAIVKTFVFNGEEGTDEIIINLPPGEHSVDLFSIWKTNGVSGNRDQFLGKIKCVTADPELEVEKLQKYSNKQKYTKELLKLGHEGNVVDYEIIVKNSGNVPLTLNFKDLGCDEGTISGGPTGPLGRGESTTYFCRHTLTKADVEAGSRCNTATVEGEGEGGPVTKESNTVCVELPKPGVNTTFGCKTFVVHLSGFPNATNTVKIKITVDKKVVVEEFFTFTGPEANFTYEANLGPGHHSVDVFVVWKTNGFSGNRDQTLAHGITCEPEPGFSIVKYQKRDGSSEPFTTEYIEDKSTTEGTTIDYKIVVTNTGNVPLTLENFVDKNTNGHGGCDQSTIEGPSVNPVQPAGPKIPPGEAVYTCSHTIADEELQFYGFHENNAQVTGTPPAGDGSPVTNTSNNVFFVFS